MAGVMVLTTMQTVVTIETKAHKRNKLCTILASKAPLEPLFKEFEWFDRRGFFPEELISNPFWSKNENYLYGSIVVLC